MRGNKFNKIKYRPWFRSFRRLCAKFIVPFLIFQLIRTLLFPTFFDILLLTCFIVIAASLFLEVI